MPSKCRRQLTVRELFLYQGFISIKLLWKGESETVGRYLLGYFTLLGRILIPKHN